MGLGKRSLPSRAAGTDPHVTLPVVTVSGRHSLMLAVEGGECLGAGWPPLPCSGLRGLGHAPASRPSSPLPSWKGEIHTPNPLSEYLTFSAPSSALSGLAALTV